MRKELTKALTELTSATNARDEYEIEYEVEKAQLSFSAVVGECRNQTQRDAKVTILLNKKGMYRKMAELKSKARVAYYTWSTYKSLLEDK